MQPYNRVLTTKFLHDDVNCVQVDILIRTRFELNLALGPIHDDAKISNIMPEMSYVNNGMITFSKAIKFFGILCVDLSDAVLRMRTNDI
jgi:hypothetical protein